MYNAVADDYELDIATPRWSLPLLPARRYKGAKGGRGSGKSHFFAELMVEASVLNRDWAMVCIREIQRSLKFSAKRLIEQKISDLGVDHLFEIQATQILRRGGKGIILFEGMQDHTADSIKSLEGFMIAWVEEAHSLSSRSLELLRPTIRAQGSELWFSWNPEDPTDAVDAFFASLVEDGSDSYALVHVNSEDNPWLPDTLREERERDRKINPDTFGHVWLGEHLQRKDSQVFGGKWRVDEFTPGDDWDGPYFGGDFGFAQDPNVLVKVWLYDRRLWIEHEAYGYKTEINELEDLFTTIPGARSHKLRLDNARPETISYLQKNSELRVEAVQKWPNSIEDGVAHVRSYDEIVIHTRCRNMQREARLYSHKIDRKSGDVLKSIVDKENHGWDSVRYALSPMIKRSGVADYDKLTRW